MSTNTPILLRIQSPEGTKRLQIGPTESTCRLFELVYETFELNSFAFALFKGKNQKDEVSSSKSKTIADMGLRHGDMIYLVPVNGALLFPDTSTGINASPAGEPGSDQGASTSSGVASRPTSAITGGRANSNVEEDDVDVQLAKLDGKIQRTRDMKLCRHNTNSSCVHCTPLESYDEAFLREQNIKHLSFHAFLRKLTSGVDRGKFVALEDISCRIKSGCKEHPPWPKGICSKCQPNAITLNRQIYRHVDNIQFENTHLVERFLNYWRTTGHQRIGFLYGKYEIFPDVPLGIRANVCVIYEPPQESTRDSIKLLHDPNENDVEHIASNLGLRRVGWIFTDLMAENVKEGTVKHVRGGSTHFLTAQECVMAGHFQNQHPNPCRFATAGAFGSKFTTVCVTGDQTNHVHMEGYQVSNQCMALVRDNCLVPTKDAPELGYIRESSDKQYVPDVYYKEKDSYGNEVSRLARPLPVEYLLVDVPASTPVTPQYTFASDTAKQFFPVENRMVEGHVQDFAALTQYMAQFPPNDDDEFLNAISDFHLLSYLATMDTLPLKECMGPLLKAVREKDAHAAREWSRSEHWATVEQLIFASGSSPPNSRPGSVGATSTTGVSGSPEGEWTCPFCTFMNTRFGPSCEMCGLPRSQ